MTYEFEGKTEKDAIELAASELGLQRDQFEVEIFETKKFSIQKRICENLCSYGRKCRSERNCE